MIAKLLKSGLLILLITMALAEVSLRIFHAVSPNYLFESRSYLSRWRGEPGAQALGIQLNSGGFKDLEFGPREPSRYRIVALGDSFAYGVVPYANNYLTLLEEKLGRRGKFEVLNMGIPGLGPDNYRELLIEEGLALKPNMVLLSFFIGNDLTDGMAEKHLDDLLGKEKYLDAANRLLESAYLTKALRYLFVILPKISNIATLQNDQSAAGKITEYCDTCPAADWGTFLMIETITANQFFTNASKTVGNVNRAMGSIQKIKAICDEQGIDLAIVLIPDTLQLDQELHEVVITREYQEHREYWDPLFPNKLIISQLKSMAIPYLDLYDTMLEHSVNEPLYVPRDTHWNIRGNELGADKIFDFLTTNNLVPQVN